MVRGYMGRDCLPLISSFLLPQAKARIIMSLGLGNEPIQYGFRGCRAHFASELGILTPWCSLYRMRKLLQLRDMKGRHMSWYRVTITDKQVVDAEIAKLQTLFDSAWLALGAPDDLAIFDGGLDLSGACNIYFTPDCGTYPTIRAIIDTYGATPCNEPTRSEERELHRLAGGENEKWTEYHWH